MNQQVPEAPMHQEIRNTHGNEKIDDNSRIPDPMLVSDLSFYTHCKFQKKIKQSSRFQERFFITDPLIPSFSTPNHFFPFSGFPEKDPRHPDLPVLPMFPKPGFSFFPIPEPIPPPDGVIPIRDITHPDWINEKISFPEQDCIIPDWYEHRKDPEKSENCYLQTNKDVLSTFPNNQQIRLIVNLCHGDILSRDAVGILLEQFVGTLSDSETRKRSSLIHIFSKAFQTVPRNTQHQFRDFLHSLEAEEMRKSLSTVIRHINSDPDSTVETRVRAEIMLQLLVIPKEILSGKNPDSRDSAPVGEGEPSKITISQDPEPYSIDLLTLDNKLFLRNCGFRFQWLE
jgi:hypothetical protein